MTSNVSVGRRTSFTASLAAESKSFSGSVGVSQVTYSNLGSFFSHKGQLLPSQRYIHNLVTSLG